MRYMLLMWGHDPDEVDVSADVAWRTSATPNAPDEPCWAPWAREMEARGVVLHDGAQLQDSNTATTVRTAGHEVLVADGPFAETKEQMAGYDIIECSDLDEAIYAASRHPVALRGGVVEVRPVLVT